MYKQQKKLKKCIKNQQETNKKQNKLKNSWPMAT